MPVAAVVADSSGVSALRRGRLPELDGLRGLAILMVVVWHYVIVVGKDIEQPIFAKINFALRYTWSGVDLFFVLSGFLIGGILMDARGSPNYFKTFYVRRACRILPLYIAVIAAFVAFSTFCHARKIRRFDVLIEGNMPIWTYFAFIQNFWTAFTNEWGPHFLAVTWSLAIEEQFYLVLPLFIWLVPKKALPVALLIVIPLAVYSRIQTLNLHSGLASFMLPYCRLDALCAGVLAAWAVRSPRCFAALRKYYSVTAGVFLICLGAIAYYTWHDWSIATSPPVSRFGHTWLAGMYVALLLMAVVTPEGIFGRLMRIQFLQQWGVLAYGIYLFHSVANYGFHGFFFYTRTAVDGPKQILATLAALALTLIAAKLSWKYFEKPILDLGHRFKY